MVLNDAYYYCGFIIMWISRFSCWCILNDKGDKVRDPYWGTLAEARDAIDSGIAL